MFKSVLNHGIQLSNNFSQLLCKNCANLTRPVYRYYGKNTLEEQMKNARKKRLRSTLYYVTAAGIVTAGLSYAAVPLYRMFCQAYSYGGTTVQGHDSSKIEAMKSNKNREIKVRFNADKGSNMRWNFKPQQTSITVFPGETALAFYTARNPTDEAVVGISTYNVVPFEAGQYFNKIQCFCFEEQMLNPHEQVDMPVFFYIDPDFTEDPFLENCNEIILSYTFFEAKEGMKLPFPQFSR
ncbi:cytochrome c oxidase copper chaperone COX11 [Rhynchophorus ferrugineus]|uniref:cytochrome c oxidase copper chaperone COX11 n=1 Tax=Rhynchophorus ferrugineus TaxID=354439 RepID=UPI003FCD02A4